MRPRLSNLNPDPEDAISVPMGGTTRRVTADLEARVEELEAALRELLDGAREMDNPTNTIVSTADIEDARAALDKDTA